MVRLQQKLYFINRNGALGGALRADFFKDEEKEKQKFDKKIKNILTYCEEDKYDEVRKIIYEKIKNQGKDFFAVILKMEDIHMKYLKINF